MLQISTQRLFSTQNSNPSLFVAQSNLRKQCKLSQHEAYREAVLITSQLASITSMASNVQFHC